MKLIAILLLLAAVTFAQTDLKNLRTAKGDTLTSPELPKLKIVQNAFLHYLAYSSSVEP